MLKKVAIIACIGCVFYILAKSKIMEYIMVFVLVGAIPGTGFALSPDAMLVLIILLSLISILAFSSNFIANMKLKRLSHKQTSRKENQPKKRYSNLKI